jgi:hypothetical protein
MSTYVNDHVTVMIPLESTDLASAAESAWYYATGTPPGLGGLANPIARAVERVIGGRVTGRNRPRLCGTGLRDGHGNDCEMEFSPAGIEDGYAILTIWSEYARRLFECRVEDCRLSPDQLGSWRRAWNDDWTPSSSSEPYHLWAQGNAETLIATLRRDRWPVVNRAEARYSGQVVNPNQVTARYRGTSGGSCGIEQHEITATFVPADGFWTYRWEVRELYYSDVLGRRRGTPGW